MKNLVLFILVFYSCSQTPKKVEKAKVATDSIYIVQPVAVPEPTCALEDSLKKYGLVNVQDEDSTLFVNLRYSGTNNFIKTDVYGCLTKAYLQQEIVDKLVKAHALLKSKDSTKRILIWDAVRPRSVQQVMWDTLKMPFQQKVRFVSNPKNGSVHNFGCAVDLTLCDTTGIPLAMGTDFDHFGPTASTRNEWRMHVNDSLTRPELDNRLLLRKIMRQAGFSSISSEWWHFNGMYRSQAVLKYAIVE